MNSFIYENRSLSSYCTYKTGGMARYLALPTTIDELCSALEWCHSLGYEHEIIGNGSNLLISDKGYNGVVICLVNFEKWCVHKGDTVYAGAGVSLNDIVKYACEHNLGGIETLAGIPASFGGAVRMNAGAFGTEIKDVLSRVYVLEGNIKDNSLYLEKKMLTNKDADFSYRFAKGLVGKIVLSAELSLNKSQEDLQSIYVDTIKKRALKQPLSYPNCGSVFKRPIGGYAGQMIEECGLKGYSIGGAQVSDKHANFIVNTGNALSQDIYNLIQMVKAKVLSCKGVLLEEEVRYLGDFILS